MTETRVMRDYDRWLTSSSLSARLYSLLTTVPGMILVNTPVFRLDRELQLKPEQRLLDVGCGPGSLLRVLASRTAFETRPIGVDLSRAMLGSHRSRGAIELLQGAGSALPVADGSIDVALSAHVMKHMTDYELLRFFQELWRVLTPGGYAVLWEFTNTRSARLNAFNKWVVTQGVRDCNFRSFKELVELAAPAGFEWAGPANLRPFLYPPIPRVSVILGKAPEGWMRGGNADFSPPSG